MVGRGGGGGGDSSRFVWHLNPLRGGARQNTAMLNRLLCISREMDACTHAIDWILICVFSSRFALLCGAVLASPPIS